MKSKFFGYLLLLSIVPLSLAPQVGATNSWREVVDRCYLADPENDRALAEYNKKLLVYRAAAEIKARVNIRRIGNLEISDDFKLFFEDLRAVAPLLAELKKVASTPYVKKLGANRLFLSFTKDQRFLAIIGNPLFLENQNHDSKLDLILANPKERAILEHIQAMVDKKEVFEAIGRLNTQQVNIFSFEGSKSATDVLRDYKKVIDSLIEKDSFVNRILLASLRYPRNTKNSTAMARLKELYDRFILREYLFENPVQENDVRALRRTTALNSGFWKEFDQFYGEAKKQDSKLTIAEYINQERLPRRSAMDQYLVKTHLDPEKASPMPIQLPGEQMIMATPHQLLAIDALARTLVGEAAMCAPKSAQFEAITRIVVERSEHLDHILKVNENIQLTNGAILEKNAELFLDYGSKVSIIPQKTETDPHVVYGRPSKIGVWHFDDPANPGSQINITAGDLHPVAQVVSAPSQFNAWSERRPDRPVTLGGLALAMGFHLPVNIPKDLSFSFYKPFAGNSMSDLAYTLCPTNEKKVAPQIWTRALELASRAVLMPDKFKAEYRWSRNEKIVSYTHQNIDISSSTLASVESPVLKYCAGGDVKACKNQVLFAGPSTCPTFRLFKLKGR